MGISSSQLQPQELVSFKKLPTDVPLDNIEIPERPENRHRTNTKWLIGLGVFIALLLPFLIYTLVYSDVNRIIRGTDRCGNVCGQKNYHWDGISCSGQDFTLKPYLQLENEYYGGEGFEMYDFRARDCVEYCRDGYFPMLGRCLKGEKSYDNSENTIGSQDVSKIKFKDRSIGFGVYLDSVKWQIVISCLISILVALGMLFLFRYAVAFVVWGILIGCFLGVLILTAVCWYFYLNYPTVTDDSGKTALPAVIILTVFTIGVGVVLIWCRKKIRLVILLLKEATKAVFDMPKLITIPIISVFAIMVLTFFFLLTTSYMSTAGTLTEAFHGFYIYTRNPVMTFTMLYNFVVYLWLVQFFTGIQYMIIAGAVSKWYFSRDKTFLGSPIMTSASNAFHYHLGTVALGALIIAIVQLIKSIILSLISNEKVKILVQSCIESIESFFKFLSKNAYIITAMHGQAFIRSGKRAAKLIIQNISDIIAINFIGDFVLGMAKVLIVVITLLLSMGVFAIAPATFEGSDLIAYGIIGIVSLVVACVTFGVFETTIDTLFICYCEDSLLNDGMARPYFMSRNLMEFVQNSKEVYGKKN